MAPKSTTLLRHSVLAAACVGLNVGLGKTANLAQLPIYLDTVGTILSAALVPAPLALAVAAVSAIANGLIIHPAFFFYIGTQIVIAVVAVLGVRLGWFEKLWSAVLTGLVIALAAAVASAPVTAMVFGGVTLPSATAINALLLAAGNGLWTSVITGSLIVESIDKTASAILVWLITKRLPRRLRANYETNTAT